MVGRLWLEGHTKPVVLCVCVGGFGEQTEQRDEQKAWRREQAKGARSSEKEEALAQLIDTPVNTPQQKERQKAAIAALQAKASLRSLPCPLASTVLEWNRTLCSYSLHQSPPAR